MAPYSSRGPSWYDGYANPDILAPGHKMVSMTPSDSYLFSHFAQNRAQAVFQFACTNGLFHGTCPGRLIVRFLGRYDTRFDIDHIQLCIEPNAPGSVGRYADGSSCGGDSAGRSSDKSCA